MTAVNWYDAATPPKFRLRDWLKSYERCRQWLARSGYVYAVLDGATVQAIAGSWQEHFGTGLRSADAVARWLLQYPGQHLDGTFMERLLYELTGFHEQFAAGVDPVRWNCSCPVWAPMLVASADFTVDRRVKIQLRTAAGPASGIFHERTITASYMRMLLKEAIGRKWWKEDEVVPHPINLGGMWLVSLYTSQGPLTLLDQVHASSSQRAHNKRLLRDRSQPCDSVFCPGEPCTVFCPVPNKLCRRSVHIREYPLRTCLNAVQSHQGYIVENGYCSKCLRSGWISKQTASQEKEEL